MLQCFLLRRKLYDYVEKALSASEQEYVAQHLLRCDHCAAMVRRIESVLKSVGVQAVPQPQKEFWDRFEVELDAKIAASSISALRRFKNKLYPFYFAVPALAMVCIAFISAQVYQRQYNPDKQISQAEQRLVKETLDYEFETAQMGNGDEDSLQYDIDLLDELEGNSVS